MAPGDLFEGDPADTEAALMAATYRALCEYGYADLTIQAISESFEKSPSLLYHHYDGKDDLLVAFLDYVLEEYEAEVPFEDCADAWTCLQALLDHVLAPGLSTERREFTAALVELRAQAAHDEAYRAAFTRHDRFFHDRIADVVREGVERGEFRAVDPESVASLVQATLNGAMVQRVTTDTDAAGGEGRITDVREELEIALASRLREDADR